MPHYTRDYPLESLFEQDKIVEQLILFGNSNDTELKRAITPIYEIVFEKMQQVLEARLNPILKKATDSDPARRHLVSGADQEYLQISYPSLDESQYTQVAFQTRTEQTSMKTYSFIAVLDALIKNCFNLCTEDVLVSKFANMMGNFIVPLLQRLHRINPTRVRKMVFGYLALFRRLVAQTNLSDPKQTLFLVPALKVSISLLRVLDVSSIKQEEYLANRGYFLFLFDCYVHLLLLRADFQDCWQLMINFDSQHSVLVTEIDNILLSLEYLRELEVKVVKGDQSGSYLSDKLEEFKKVFKKLQKASSALYFSQKAQGVIDLYILNHLRAVLLQSNPESIDPEFNHYSGSVSLLTKMLSLEVEEITLQIIRSLNMSLFSTDTLGFPGISGMTKELTYRALCDKRLATVLFSSGLLSKSIGIVDAAFELLHNFVKKAFEKKEIDNTPAKLLIPIIMPTAASQNRSRSLLELLATKDPKFLLYQACSELFSKDKRTRSDAYAKMYQEEFFDTCLGFAPTTTATQKRVIQNSKQPPKSVRVQFTDPLHGIIDGEGRLVYYGRLTDFRSKEAKLGRITQAQIRSLQELLQLAVNEHLDFNVRGVAIDQITEAIYFYRDSAALEDLAGTLLDLCVENITSFGNCRENFTMLVANLRTQEEDLSLRVSPEDLPLQNTNYPEEKLLASKYLNLFNVLIKDYRGLRDARHEVLEEIFTSTQRKGFARALWLFGTERDLDFRYPSMVALSMVFLGNPSLHENLVGYKPGQTGQETIQQVEMDKAGKSKPELVKKTGPVSQIKVLSVFDETYFIILDSASRYNHVSEEHPLQRCEPAKKEQIVRYIQAFITESTGAEGSYLSFDPKVNKNKLEQLLVDKMLTKGLKLYTSALKKERGLEHIEVWTNGALVCTFIGRTDFWEEAELYAGYFEELRIKLNQGKDQDYVQAVTTLTNLIKCEEFRLGYVASSVQQAFVHALAIQLHEKILPNLYEYHVERFAEKHEVIVKTFQLMSSILQVALESNDQKLVVLTRGFITRNNFMEFLADVFRRFESMDILSSALIEFLRVHFDLFMKKGSDAKFVSILTLIYDSALICTRTDNFFGIERLRNVLRLTHALCSKNQFISLGVKKPLYEDMKEMSTREETRMPTAFKTSTIAWIFSLLDHRCIDVRISCWNIVCNYLDASLLELFPSQLESCIATCSLVNEATGVKT